MKIIIWEWYLMTDKNRMLLVILYDGYLLVKN